MRKSILVRVLQFAGAVALVAGITAFYHRFLPANATTVALTLLLGVLVVSAAWGLSVSVFMSVVSMFAFNYYFLPPVRTLTVADPQNWVALCAFLVVSVFASQLSTRARQQAADAEARQRDIEKLYTFSQDLLQSGNAIQLLNQIPAQIVDTFEVGAAALFLADKQKVYRSGPVVRQLDLESMKHVLTREEPLIDQTNSVCFVPVRLGVRPIGSLGISGQPLSRQTLEAIGTLIALAMEHARAIEKLGQTEAARQGEQLRTALLDAITHALRTPLTSIKVSVTNLLSNTALQDSQRHELLTVINEESDRLNRLVGEAAEMARLDAGEVELEIKPHPMQDVVKAALDECKNSLGSRTIDIRIPANLPRVMVDLARVREVLVHLIDNANQYSPADQPITISAESNGDTVTTSVADRGAGIDAFEQTMIFEKFYRGKDQRYSVEGTGMGLPIAKAIVQAHRGTIGLTSQPGQGSVFSFSLPAEGGRQISV